MSVKLNPTRLKSRVARARSAVRKGCTYKLGKGGFNPRAVYPFDAKGQCDCSGFVAWVIGTTRDQVSVGKLWAAWIPWIETSAIVKDATGAQRLFVQIPEPVPGCLVVYGDKGVSSQGHVAVVTAVRGRRDYDIVDCSSGSFRLYGEAIRERKDTVFVNNPRSIFVALKEDRTP